MIRMMIIIMMGEEVSQPFAALHSEPSVSGLRCAVFLFAALCVFLNLTVILTGGMSTEEKGTKRVVVFYIIILQIESI